MKFNKIFNFNIPLLLYLVLLNISYIQSNVYTAELTNYTIGALLSNESMIRIFEESVKKENLKYRSFNIIFYVKAQVRYHQNLFQQPNIIIF